MHGQWLRTSVGLASMPSSPPELTAIQGNCVLPEMNFLPSGRMVLIKETELPCRETAVHLIDLSLQNICTLKPLMECKGQTNEEGSKEPYPKTSPFWTFL